MEFRANNARDAYVMALDKSVYASLDIAITDAAGGPVALEQLRVLALNELEALERHKALGEP